MKSPGSICCSICIPPQFNASRNLSCRRARFFFSSYVRSGGFSEKSNLSSIYILPGIWSLGHNKGQENIAASFREIETLSMAVHGSRWAVGSGMNGLQTYMHPAQNHEKLKVNIFVRSFVPKMTYSLTNRKLVITVILIIKCHTLATILSIFNRKMYFLCFKL